MIAIFLSVLSTFAMPSLYVITVPHKLDGVNSFLGYNYVVMKRYWPLLIIVAILVAVIGVSQYAESAKQHCEESARKTKAAAVTKDDDAKASNNAEDACKPPEWARYVTWPEGVGAWAVILTLFVIAWQSIETAKAAKATEDAAQATRDSVLLQERAMQQWIEATNWKADILQLIPGAGGLLSIRLDIVNPTQFPIKIIGGSMLFINSPGFRETLDFPKISLTPNVPFETGVVVEVTEQQVQDYASEPIFITVAGVWSHIGALEKATSQALVGSLYCAKDSTVFTPTLHMNPIKADTQDQNPN